MKEMTYEQIIKTYNESVLGRMNDYDPKPKLAMSFDHNGCPIFFILFRFECDEFDVDDVDENLIVDVLSHMTGQQFDVTYKGRSTGAACPCSWI